METDREREIGLRRKPVLLGQVELELEVLDVLLGEWSSVGQRDQRSPLDVQVGEMQAIGLTSHLEGRVHAGDFGPFGQDDSERKVLDEHVVIDVVDHAHVQDVTLALMVQILVAGHVIADEVMGLPAAEKRESRSKIQFHRIHQRSQSRRGNVADIIPIVHIGG